MWRRAPPALPSSSSARRACPACAGASATTSSGSSARRTGLRKPDVEVRCRGCDGPRLPACLLARYARCAGGPARQEASAVEIRVEQGDILGFGVKAIVVNLLEGVDRPGGATGAVDRALDGAISRLIRS